VALDLLHRKLIIKLAIFAVAMLGFTYLMVPVYEKACEIGWLEAKREGEEVVRNTQVDTDRWVTVEFVANVNKELPWQFEPMQASVKVNPGQLTHIAYKVTNLTERSMVGQSVASYGPAQAGRYFKKIECFCYKMQPLQAHESKEMPVVFVVTPDLPEDINVITLSYTFFELESDDQPSADKLAAR
jgi:cytochrome c oxidase assembly protein subunit 11